MRTFKLTQKQLEAFGLLRSYPGKKPLYLLMYGGSQSAKTSFACLFLQMSALKYPHTTAIICRKSFVDLKATIVQNTFPKILSLKFGEHLADDPDFVSYNLSPPMHAQFHNGSRIYFIGLEDNNNFEKILGRQVSQFLIDEASEVGYRAYSKLTTRMSEDSGARKIGFVTMNPTSVFHWCHKLFLEKKNPIDDQPLKNSQFFKSIQMNPHDNLDNLPEGYIENLENLSAAERERFLFGAFTLTTEDAVYEEQLKKAKDENRIKTLLPANPNYPIYFSLDLGWDDFNASWLFQVLPDGVYFFKYFEARYTTIVEFVKQIKDVICTMIKTTPREIIGILPHDALQHSVQTGLNIKQLLTLAAAHDIDNPISYKQLDLKGKYDGINVSRLFFSKCYFDDVGCDVGVRRLGQYKETLVDSNDAFKRKAIHNAASHCADAFRYAMVNIYKQNPRRKFEQRDPSRMYADDILDKKTRESVGL